MEYREKLEDEGFVYELTVQPSGEKREHLYTLSQGQGFYGRWLIRGKDSHAVDEVSVTDQDCEVIVFQSVEAAVAGAKQFLDL
jgi:hypothetical protein